MERAGPQWITGEPAALRCSGLVGRDRNKELMSSYFAVLKFNQSSISKKARQQQSPEHFGVPQLSLGGNLTVMGS
jgi:hypothetical protein